MKMKSYAFAVAAGLVVLFGSTGCESTGTKVVTQGDEHLVTSDINITDWENVGDKLGSRIIESGTLDRVPADKKPALLVVDRIVNNTTQNVDTAQLTSRLLQMFNASGKANAWRMDEYQKQMQAKANWDSDGQAERVRMADFVLTGRLMETRARDGKTREVTYTFHMRIATANGAATLWEGQESISKISKKAGISF